MQHWYMCQESGITGHLTAVFRHREPPVPLRQLQRAGDRRVSRLPPPAPSGAGVRRDFNVRGLGKVIGKYSDARVGSRRARNRTGRLLRPPVRRVLGFTWLPDQGSSWLGPAGSGGS